MTTMIKVIIRVLLLMALFHQFFALEKGCKKSDIDGRMRPITDLVASKTFKWPANDKQLSILCNTLPRQIGDSRQFVKNCTKGITKTMLSISLHTAEKSMVKLVCRQKGERDKFVARGNCANKGKAVAAKCWTKAINQLTEVKSADSKLRLPLVCCTMLLWKDCFVKSYQDMGSAVCTQKDVEYLEQYLYKAFQEPLNIFCAEFDGSDKCEKIIDRIPKTGSTRIKYATIFPALIDIFETL